MKKRIIKKLGMACLSSTMIFGGILSQPNMVANIYATWPEPGYNLLPETQNFGTNEEAMAYANANLSSICKKYGMDIQFKVEFVTTFGYIVSFYGKGYSESSTKVDSNVLYQGRVTGDGLRVRSGPGTEYGETKESPVNTNDMLDIYGEVNGWYYIKIKGNFGYVSAKYVEIVSNVAQSGGLNTTVQYTGTVTGDGLRVRSGPGTNYPETKDSPVNAGDTVNICDETNGWYFIKINNNYGYVSAQYVTKDPAHGYTTGPQVKFKVKVLASALNVRSGPGVEYATVKDSPVYYGDVLEVCDETNGWYQIVTKSGLAYVCAYYVEVI